MESLIEGSKVHCFTSGKGFSLVEVVLATGIFLVTVLALVGLLGPILQSVDEVEKADEVASVVNSLNAFLQSSPDIAVSNQSKFETIYKELRTDGFSTVFVFRSYDNDDAISLKVGFSDKFKVGDATKAQVTASDIRTETNVKAAGPVYRCVLTASSVTPDVHKSRPVRDNDGKGFFYLDKNFNEYPEGYLAMEVHIFAEDPEGAFIYDKNLQNVANFEPIFTYNTAIVR